jgi:hypothetical protein
MGITFNLPWWSLVHQQMFLNLKPLYPALELGGIKAFISSAHIYENKWPLVKNILDNASEKFFIRWKLIPLGKSFDWYKDNLHKYFTVEKLPILTI